MIVSGDPIGPPEQLDGLVASFVRFARRRDWRIAILGASERLLDIYARHGLQALYHGDEAVLDVDAFTPAVPCAVLHVRGRWIDMVYEASVPAESTVLSVDGAEVLEAQFHRLDALPPLTLATARLLSHYGIGPYADYPEARV